MMKKLTALLLTLLMTLTPVLAEDGVSLTDLISEIDAEAEVDKALNVGVPTFTISEDRQSIFIDRPEVSGSEDYTIAYNIYDAASNPVNYFYSLEDRVAATPGYGGLFNVFVVVTDRTTGAQNTQNIGWQTLSWPLANMLTVGEVSATVSEDRMSIYVDRPEIRCRSGEVTIAYNIYDSNSNPVNYFYSTEKRVAATPGYDGLFNVFVVVTDPQSGEQLTRDIGWTILGRGPQPTAAPTPTPTPAPSPTPDPTEPPILHTEDFSYQIRDGGVTILSYNRYFDRVDIPSELDGYPVVAIGYDAFAGHDNLLHVTIPDTVTSIGSRAFQGCIWLPEIHLPAGLTELGISVFQSCESLTELSIPEGVTIIPDRTFKWCSGLKAIHLPGNITAIGDEAFMYCHDLKEIDIPDSVTSITYYAFYGCKKMEALRLGAGSRLTTVDNNILGGCDALTVYGPAVSPMRDCCNLYGIPYVVIE
ncbi:MAG: leucine-rich repeat domain-containing protein [Clostridia bacterium]|nr:leucine-rich repeat domain-containing protein [Clostridia bacterium]